MSILSILAVLLLWIAAGFFAALFFFSSGFGFELRRERERERARGEAAERETA